MWNITSTDVENAKERLELRRAEIEARYAEEKKSLDSEMTVIEAFERAASEFALRHPGHRETDLAGPPEGDEEPVSGGEMGGERDILKPGSRWRLYRAGRAPDTEAVAGDAAPGDG